MSTDRAFDTVNKYDGPNLVVSTPALERAFLMVRAQLTPVVRRLTQVPSFWDLLHDVDLSTSPGFPHNRLYKSKDLFFSDSTVVAQLNAELIDGSWDRDYLWTSFPKDEVIKVGKNVRQICGCETPFLFHLMPLVHDFNKSIETAGRRLPLFLGTSFVLSDWDHYVNTFEGCGFSIALDASSFDTSVSSQMYDLVVRLRTCFLENADDSFKLGRLYDSVVNKHVVEPDGRIFSVDHGTPSGQPSTAHDNSLVMWIVITSFFVHKGWSYEEIRECIALAVYGDDCTIGFHEHPEFELSEIREWFLAFGITLKFSHPDWVDWLEVDFLSRRPYPYNGGYAPVYIRHRKMVESMRWNDGVISPSVQLERMKNLRDLCVGTDSFSDADRILSFHLEKNKVFSNTDWFVRLINSIYPEDYILESLSSNRIVQQSAAFVVGTALNVQPTKNTMSERKTSNKRGPSKVKKTTVTTTTSKRANNKKNNRGPRKPRGVQGVNAPATQQPRGPRPKANRTQGKMMSVVRQNNNTEDAYAAAACCALTGPSTCPPIRFPNSFGNDQASVPLKTRMRVGLAAVTNTTFSTTSAFSGIVLNRSNLAPVSRLQAIGNSGELTWASVGNVPGWSTISTQAMLRVNAIGVKIINWQKQVNRNGFMFSMGWNGRVAGTEYVYPDNMTRFTGGSYAAEFDTTRMSPNMEFSVPLPRLSSGDGWSYPTYTTAESNEMLALLFISSSVAGDTNNLDAQVTLHYEFAPNTKDAIVYNTAAPPASRVNMSEVYKSVMMSNDTSNASTAVPGLFTTAHSQFKALANTVRNIWTSSSTVRAVATSFMGLAEQRRVDFVVKTAHALHSQHRSSPHSITISDLLHMANWLSDPSHSITDRQLGLIATVAHDVVAVHPQLRHTALTALGKRYTEPSWQVDISTLPAGSEVVSGVLYYNRGLVAYLGDSNTTLKPINAVSWNSQITGAGQLLYFGVEPAISFQLVSTLRNALIRAIPPPPPALEVLDDEDDGPMIPIFTDDDEKY